jgi:[ribosomal protein S18]-alanine N-acetyltransferase
VAALRQARADRHSQCSIVIAMSTCDVSPLNAANEARICAEMLLTTEPWITLRLTPDDAVARFTDTRNETYVIRDDQAIAAFIVLNMNGLLAGYIQTVCVRSDRRGEGLGSALIRWAENRIFRDSPNVFICVSSFNPEAQRLYERLGFEHVGVLRDFAVAGHDELLLRKTCGSWAEFRNRH